MDLPLFCALLPALVGLLSLAAIAWAESTNRSPKP